jgi:hypothetical protein
MLDDSSDDASALWLEAWSLGRRNAPLAAQANELTAKWLDCPSSSPAARSSRP